MRRLRLAINRWALDVLLSSRVYLVPRSFADFARDDLSILVDQGVRMMALKSWSSSFFDSMRFSYST